MKVFEAIRLSMKDDVARVTLCRPEIRNAVDSVLLKELIEATEILQGADNVHYVILDHEGPVFSAGAHLMEIRDYTAEKNLEKQKKGLRQYQSLAQEFVRRFGNIEQISFAALRDSAYGAGVGIAVPCDFRIMAERAVLNLPESGLGMFLAWGLTPALVHSIGLARSKEMIMLGEDWEATKCAGVGLADRVVERENVESEIQGMIARLRTRSWPAVRMCKRLANAAGALSSLGQLSMAEIELAGEALSGGEVGRRLDEFLARRGR